MKIAEREIPNLVGIKYTAAELSAFVECKQFKSGKYNMLFGADEMLLAGLSMGADGAVGSTYNFMAPIYNTIIEKYKEGNLKAAQEHQAKAAELIRIIPEDQLE